MEKSPLKSMLRPLLATLISMALVAVVGLIALAASENAGAQEQGVSTQSRSQMSALLTTASRASSPRLYVGAQQMRGRAADRIENVPFPPGRNSASGYTWEGIEGGLVDADIDDLVQYRASCDWLRHFIEAGKADDEARAVLSHLPAWPVFRGSPFGAVIRNIVDAALAGDLGPARRHVETVCVDRPDLRARG